MLFIICTFLILYRITSYKVMDFVYNESQFNEKIRKK